MPASWELPSGAGCSQAQGGRRGPSWQTPSELPGSGDISFPPPLALHSQRFLPREAIPAPHPPGTVPFCRAVERADSRLCTRPQPGQQLPGGEGFPHPAVLSSQTAPTSARASSLGTHCPCLGLPVGFLPQPWSPAGYPPKRAQAESPTLGPAAPSTGAGTLETHVTHWLSTLLADLLLPCPIQSPAAGAR